MTRKTIIGSFSSARKTIEAAKADRAEVQRQEAQRAAEAIAAAEKAIKDAAEKQGGGR